MIDDYLSNRSTREIVHYLLESLIESVFDEKHPCPSGAIEGDLMGRITMDLSFQFGTSNYGQCRQTSEFQFAHTHSRQIKTFERRTSTNDQPTQISSVDNPAVSSC